MRRERHRSFAGGIGQMFIISVLLIVIVAVTVVILLHEIVRYTAPVILHLTRRFWARASGSRTWMRSKPLRSRLVGRYPTLFEFVRSRTDPHQPIGLPLTLMVVAALYLAALFGGLTEDILEAKGTVQADNLVHAAFVTWRVEPLMSAFLWITALGSSPSVVSAVIIATGFLWSQRRSYVIAPLWVTCLGAVASTSIGKLLIGRHRPPTGLDVTMMTSSFPSGHTTVSLAVYGFIAYAIARNLPNGRERFEVAYWTAILILFIGFSRIFIGVHYLTDVVGGFLVGGFWLLVGFTMSEWLGQARMVVPGNHNGSTEDQLRHSDDEHR
jgi:membrane-associated phospholipid phosphatase